LPRKLLESKQTTNFSRRFAIHTVSLLR